VTDPPYGLSWGKTGFKRQPLLDYVEAGKWDSRRPDEEIENIKRFQQWVLWGGNYYASVLGDCPSLLIWDKVNGKCFYADCEIAFARCSTKTTRIFRHQWCGAFKDSERNVVNVHPTQKPVAVMAWCLGFISGVVCDPYMGSGTTGVACIRTGRRFIGIEIDPTYWQIAVDRCKKEIKLDKSSFQIRPKPKQEPVGFFNKETKK